MKLFTIADIRNWNPCYDPNRYLPEDWQGTALDILKRARIPAEDRRWCILRPEVMTDKGLRLFAVDCARRAQIVSTACVPDPAIARGLEIAEQFANGEATDVELELARHSIEVPDNSAMSAAYATYKRAEYAARQGAIYATAAFSGPYIAEECKKQIETLINMFKSGKPGLFTEDSK